MSSVSPQAEVSTRTLPHPQKANRDVLTVAKGGGIVFGGRLFEYGSRFVITIVLARLLGAEQLGLYNLAVTVVIVAGGLALLGLDSGLVRYVSLFAGRRDEAGLWGTLQVAFGLSAVVSVALGIGLYVWADPVAVQLFHEPRLIPLLRLVSILVPFLALGDLAAAATRGFKQMQYTVIAKQVSQPIIRALLFAVLFVMVGLSAREAVIGFVGGTIAVCIMLLYFLNKLFSLKRSPSEAQRDVREILKFSLPVYLTNVIRTFSGNVQTVLLSALGTVAQVGIFTVADRLTIVGSVFHASIVASSMPVISELYDRGEREQMGHLYQMMTKWTFTLNLPLSLAVILFPEPLLSLFGKSFVGGVAALTILAWRSLVDAGTGICGVVIDMTGNTHLKLINTIITVVFTLGLNILLIPRLGLVGAAIASLAAIGIVNSLRIVEVFVLFRLLPYNISFIKPVVAGLVALVVVLAMNELLPPERSLIFVATNLAALFVVYAGMILLLRLSQEDRLILDRLRKRLRTMLSKS